MIESIVISVAIMLFEVFVLLKILKYRDEERDKDAWMPFRKLMLDGIVEHGDELLSIANKFEQDMQKIFDNIRAIGKLDEKNKLKIIHAISETTSHIKDSRDSFYFILQTAAPSLKPYAAQYCNEVIWFSSSMLKSLKKASIHIESIPNDKLFNNSETSHSLNGVSVMLTAIKMFRDFRFANFKSNFTQSVWKNESLHYFKPDAEFLSPEDYASALETEKFNVELQNIPRTSPVKSFFENDSDGA